mmetsp:Transcript_18291/g.25778  ORF Transcript_18291/g.25778 Transcript_18291/m.25778 type:complete len:320 (-) Transcript_18291:1125-2084(-)
MKSFGDFPTRNSNYNRRNSDMSTKLQSGEEKASAVNQASTTRPGAFFIPKQRGKIDFVALVRGEHMENGKCDQKVCTSDLERGIREVRTRLKQKNALLLSKTSSRSTRDLSSTPVLDWNEQLYDLSNLCLQSDENNEETDINCRYSNRVARRMYNRSDTRSRRCPPDCSTLYPLKESISVLRIQRSPPPSTDGSRVDTSESMSSKERKRHRNQIKNHSFFLEILPGVSVTLRGSTETQKALRNGNITRVQCMECAANPYCIDDAKYVLCPHCKCISPNLNPSWRRALHGVGLGFQGYSEQDLLYDTDDNSSLSSDCDSS